MESRGELYILIKQYSIMKTKHILLVILILNTHVILSQISKGKWIVGTQLNYKGLKNDTLKSSDYKIAPQLNFVLSKNWIIGLGYEHKKEKSELKVEYLGFTLPYGINNDKSFLYINKKLTTNSLFLNVKRIIPVAGKFSLLLNAGVKYGKTNIVGSYNFKGYEDNNSNGYGFNYTDTSVIKRGNSTLGNYFDIIKYGTAITSTAWGPPNDSINQFLVPTYTRLEKEKPNYFHTYTITVNPEIYFQANKHWGLSVMMGGFSYQNQKPNIGNSNTETNFSLSPENWVLGAYYVF